MAEVEAVVPVLFHVVSDAMSNNFPSESQSHGSNSSTNADNALIDDNQAVAPVLDFTDYLMFDHVDDFTPAPRRSPHPSLGSTSDAAGVVSRVEVPPLVNVDRIQSSGDDVPGGERMGENARVAFRMKSEKEVVEDGFKWRKYGKKSVKNSSNPRNYYRCSTEGCSVKKRVERDRDPSYVITTYEGIHNHASPDVVYYATQDSASGRFYVAGCQLPPSSG